MQARHAHLIIRLVLYSVLIGLVIIALAARGNAGEPDEPDEFRGMTSQNEQLWLTLGPESRAMSIQTRVGYDCPGWQSWATRWASSGGPAKVEREDDRLRIVTRLTKPYGDGYSGSRTYTLDAKLDGDRVSGTISLTEIVTGPSPGPVRCASGPVKFSAQR